MGDFAYLDGGEEKGRIIGRIEELFELTEATQEVSADFD